jgi:hypothetical protein
MKKQLTSPRMTAQISTRGDGTRAATRSHTRLFVVCFLMLLSACGRESYPESHASYDHINATVGCLSKDSDEKKADTFDALYRDHWLTWAGTVWHASASSASLNIDEKGIQDLEVDFSDANAGYNLRQGNELTVRFLMKSAGGCILPFGGVQATIVDPNAAVVVSNERQAELDSRHRSAAAELQHRIDQSERAANGTAVDELVGEYTARIHEKILSNTKPSGRIADKDSATFIISLLPNGSVAHTRLDRSSGGSGFREAVEVAIKRSQPLPLPKNDKACQQMKEITLIFSAGALERSLRR